MERERKREREQKEIERERCPSFRGGTWSALASGSERGKEELTNTAGRLWGASLFGMLWKRSVVRKV